MKLTDIDFKGYGRFLDGKAAFEVDKYFTPERWDYIYTNRKILVRICQDGTGYAQLEPPGGTVLYKMDRYQRIPSLLVWVKAEGAAAFSNFYKPTVDVEHPSEEPDEYKAVFSPELARFEVTKHGVKVVTEIAVPKGDPALVIWTEVTNAGPARKVDIMPVWRPHNTSSALAPWDVPEHYQTTQYCNADGQVIWIETRNPGGVGRLRRRAFVMTDMACDTAEVYYDRFVGNGTFDAPEAVLSGKLGIDASKEYTYLAHNLENTGYSELPVAAFAKSVELGEGESYRFATVVAGLPEQEDGSMPAYEEISRYKAYFADGAKEKVVAENAEVYESYQSLREVKTPDEAFNRYVNEWLPLQLRWVTMLDRGWPTGLRGTRDAAQDFTGLIPLFPDETRGVLLDIFSCQRSDGWFPRQFSTDGPEGQHDLRPYVDAGCWVWEYLYDYLRFTQDMGILEEKARWLDSKEEKSILEHAKALLSYYISEDNQGEHGLVKIREGDWNDSVNAAGLEGRGESVMVSCQMVLALRQAGALLGRLGLDGKEYTVASVRMRGNLRKHGLNEQGYLNGVFTDKGEWVFSPKDPDGKKRINGPVNSFGIIAGVFEEEELPKVIAQLKTLKRANGYALFLPGIGEPPIEKLGRLGQGDLLPGLGENGNPYNHGSHGFLGRAAAAAGQGEMLRDIMKYMLPYDQEAHPIEDSKTAPYGVVNHWMSIEGRFGHGGATFLSGSITTALRNVYGGMMGFVPTLDGIKMRPCLPAEWSEVRYVHNYGEGLFDVTIENPGVESGVSFMEVNGRRVEGDMIPAELIIEGSANKVRVVMG